MLAKPGTTQRYGVHWLGTTRPLANARVLCDQEETASAALAAVTQASREVSTAGARLQRLMLTDVQNQLATVQLRSAEFVEETNGLNNEVEQARNMVTSSRETVASQERCVLQLSLLQPSLEMTVIHRAP